MIRQNYTTVNLKKIGHNYLVAKESLPSNVQVMAVVKADAYGHGIFEVSKTVTQLGCTCLAVALVEEGIYLRNKGIDCDILVLGATMENAILPAIENDLTLTVFTNETLILVDNTARNAKKTAKINIKLDTGMGRIGLINKEETQSFAKTLAVLTNINATGIYTHFADADNEESNEYTQSQLKTFNELSNLFPPQIPRHVANSAAAINMVQEGYRYIRQGISLYGYPPIKTNLDFQAALEWKTEIVHIKEVDIGAKIGYNCTYTASKKMRVATVAVGYGDGYHRAISNVGQMLVKGKRANVIGKVCMDQTMIDVTDIPNVEIGDTVVLIGTQGKETIDAQELAIWAGTISYEVLLAITPRVPRLYT